MRHLIAVSLLLAGSVAMADDCEFQADRSFTVDRGEITALNVKTGRNDLRVQGEAGLAQIVVTAKACASDEEDLPKLAGELSAVLGLDKPARVRKAA